MIKKIISIANTLDQNGLTKEADILDRLLIKTSEAIIEDSEDPNDKIISGLTLTIEGLSELENSAQVKKDLDLLSTLLEKYLA